MNLVQEATKLVGRGFRLTGRRQAPRRSGYFMGLFALLAANAGCSPDSPRVIGETPDMVSICRDTNFDSYQSVADLAEQRCMAYGKHAIYIPSLEDCPSGILTGELSTFKCG
ncbi:MAG TPA: hypothetical protein VEJ16_16180 [Alphaproteobacteria bacterium]|nr:hypothetical protein [Alphaproteobacteria bacterium]